MEPLERIEKLAERARMESPPEIEVRLNHLLGAVRKQSTGSLALAWPAAISAIAACVLLVLAIHANTSQADTVTPLFAPLQVEMP